MVGGGMFGECAGRLTELLGQTVELAPDCIGEEVKAKIAALKVRPVYFDECALGIAVPRTLV
jgi:3-phosphoglycerate kinase